MRGIVVYKGKYGATRQYAEWLGAELELLVQPAEKLTKGKPSLFDYVVIGSSVYFGRLLMAMLSDIDQVKMEKLSKSIESVRRLTSGNIMLSPVEAP